MDYLDQLAKQRIEGDGASLPPDDIFAKEYPWLWELLTCRIIWDEKQKLPARLSISVGMGCWVVSVQDESLAMSMSVTSPTIADAFREVEAALHTGQCWTEYRKRNPKLREVPEEKVKPRRHPRKK